MKKKIILTVALLFAIIVSMGIVSASENMTTDNPISLEEDNDKIAQIDSNNEKLSDDENSYPVEIVAKASNKNVKVEIKDPYYTETNVVADCLYYKFDNGTKKIASDYDDSENGAVYKIPHNLKNGRHTVILSISDSVYTADPLFIEFYVNNTEQAVTKKTPTVKTTKCTTTGKYVTLKATVTYDGKKIKDGKVKFTIKGKTYTVKVKNGVAIKKLKVKNGYHKYKATFSSSKYKTKSSSNYAIKGKKYYTLKAKGVDGKTYTIKIPFKKYLKLVNAKRGGYYTSIKVKTGKTAKFISSKDIYKTKTVYKWKKIKVLDYESFWDYGESYSYSTSKYFNNGWTYVGGYDKTYSDGYEHYSIFKKKVKTTKKVWVGTKNVYSSKNYPLRFSAGVNENGKLYCRWDISRESQLKANLIIPHWSGKL